MNLEEELQDVPEVGVRRVVADLDRLGMARMIPVRRVIVPPAGVTDLGGHDAGLLADQVLHTPEAAARQDRLLIVAHLSSLVCVAFSKQGLIVAVSLRREVVTVNESQRRGVDAVAQPAVGFGSVVEHVPKVAVTVRRLKLCQPEPLSNLSVEANNGSPDTTST